MAFVRRTQRSVAAFAVVPAVVATLALAGGLGPVLLGLFGTVVLAAGVTVASRRVVSLGALAVFGGVLVAGTTDGSTALLVLAAAGTVASWSTGQHVVGLAHQLGREAGVRRSVLAHLAGTTAISLSAGAVGLVTSRAAGGAVPAVAAAFLLVGVVALLVALRS